MSSPEGRRVLSPKRDSSACSDEGADVANANASPKKVCTPKSFQTWRSEQKSPSGEDDFPLDLSSEEQRVRTPKRGSAALSEESAGAANLDASPRKGCNPKIFQAWRSGKKSPVTDCDEPQNLSPFKRPKNRARPASAPAGASYGGGPLAYVDQSHIVKSNRHKYLTRIEIPFTLNPDRSYPLEIELAYFNLKSIPCLRDELDWDLDNLTINMGRNVYRFTRPQFNRSSPAYMYRIQNGLLNEEKALENSKVNPGDPIQACAVCMNVPKYGNVDIIDVATMHEPQYIPVREPVHDLLIYFLDHSLVFPVAFELKSLEDSIEVGMDNTESVKIFPIPDHRYTSRTEVSLRHGAGTLKVSFQVCNVKGCVYLPYDYAPFTKEARIKGLFVHFSSGEKYKIKLVSLPTFLNVDDDPENDQNVEDFAFCTTRSRSTNVVEDSLKRNRTPRFMDLDATGQRMIFLRESDPPAIRTVESSTQVLGLDIERNADCFIDISDPGTRTARVRINDQFKLVPDKRLYRLRYVSDGRIMLFQKSLELDIHYANISSG